jgi:flagellin
MAMVINSNIQSLNAQRHLNNSLSAQNTATERLSSGLRINSASDDAAGLAIANRMTSQVKGLNMAIRNANDGVSMIQTAEGALSETTNILQRMRELSIQSANGIYDEGNRGTLNAEVQQLKAEVDRISETTSFNGLNILDGSLGKVGLQIGEQANQTIDLQIQKMDTKTLGLGSTSVDVLGAAVGLGEFAAANGLLDNNDVLINGQSIMKIGETFDNASDSMGDLIEKINTNVNGVTASTRTDITAATAGNGVLAQGTDVLTITVADLEGETRAFEITGTESLQEVADKINDLGAGIVSASINDKGKLTISAEDSSSITIAGTGASVANTGTPATKNASIALTSDNGDPVTVERGSSGQLSDLNALGFRESNESGALEGTAIDANAFAAGDLTINGVEVGKSDSGDLDDKIAAINKVSDESGVKAEAFTSLRLDFSGVGDLEGGTIKLNGVNVVVGAGSSGQPAADFLADVNGATAQTGITATMYGSELVLEGNVGAISITAGSTAATDDPEIVLADDTTAAEIVGVMTNATELGAGPGTFTDLTATGVSVNGGIKLESENGNPIGLSLSATGAAKSGLIEHNSSGDGKFGSALNSLDISTAAGANKAIEILDTAIQTVSDVRGELGAVTNRLDHTVKNLSNVSENAAAARSRIMDSDFAAESANLSRAQVLQQAGNAMLAQANSRPQQVLSLLQ